MTFVITEACIDVKDQSCVEVCPVDCIYADEQDRMLFIDPDVCIDCAVCESACPVAAIYPDNQLPEKSRMFLDLNALYYTDKEAARQKVDEIDTTTIG